MANDFDLNNSMSHKTNIVPMVIKSNKWPENSVLITGDSILNNLQENRLNKNFNVKVGCFPGADIDDMFDFIIPLLKKVSRYIILHIGYSRRSLGILPYILVTQEGLSVYYLTYWLLKKVSRYIILHIGYSRRSLGILSYILASINSSILFLPSFKAG